MFVTAIALKYALLVSQWSYGHFLKLTDSILFELTRYFTRRIMSCYTHKMAIVSWTIDLVTSLHPMHILCFHWTQWTCVVVAQVRSTGTHPAAVLGHRRRQALQRRPASARRPRLPGTERRRLDHHGGRLHEGPRRRALAAASSPAPAARVATSTSAAARWRQRRDVIVGGVRRRVDRQPLLRAGSRPRRRLDHTHELTPTCTCWIITSVPAQSYPPTTTSSLRSDQSRNELFMYGSVVDGVMTNERETNSWFHDGTVYSSHLHGRGILAENEYFPKGLDTT